MNDNRKSIAKRAAAAALLSGTLALLGLGFTTGVAQAEPGSAAVVHSQQPDCWDWWYWFDYDHYHYHDHDHDHGH
jgi:hypothetical protein